MEHTKKIGIWIRVSTEDQAKGDSPEHHERRAKMYAESKGWDVVKTYHLEALSGKSVMNYDETKRMLEDIKNGDISGIIFSKLARLARNTKELLEFADIFKEYGADLISLQEAIDTSSPAGRLFYTMIAAMAQWEREEIADRVAASIPIRAKMGKNLGGYPPLGYKWEDGTLVIDEQTAPIRKLIYELFLEHKRKKTVARILNEKGYRSQRGKPFTDTGIGHVLKDPISKGQRRLNYRKRAEGKKVFKPIEEWIFVPCPAIVSTEVWDECNRILEETSKKRKPKGRKAKHLLAGFVQCECGRKMYVYHATKTPKYACQKCRNRISEEDLNYIYREQLKTFLLTDTDLQTYVKQLDDELVHKNELLQAALEEKAKLKKRIDGLVAMRAVGELSKSIFTEQYQPLEEQYVQLSDQIPELQSAVDIITVQHQSSEVVLQNAKDLYSKWDVLSYEDKRHIVELITDTIIVGKEDIHMKLSYLPTKTNNTPPTTPTEKSVKKQAPLSRGFFVMSQLCQTV